MESPEPTPDPVGDHLGSDNSDLDPVEREEEDTPEEHELVEESDDEPIVPKNSRPKKSMEKSFDDLLMGLSDESEPELDEMLGSDHDNTNLESLLVTPNTSIQKSARSDDIISPTQRFQPLDTMETLSSTPQRPAESSDEEEVKFSPPEVRVQTPDEEEFDEKDWEHVNKEQTEESVFREKIEGDNYDDDDSEDDTNLDDVLMRNRTDSQRSRSASKASTDDGDLDLSAVVDTNHLDVGISKQKSALGKKGSLALRRKQSRKSRRSLLANDEDALFQDSTEPKPVKMMNGEEDRDDDMSPPPKKQASPAMVPLPGMIGMPPSQRLQSSNEGASPEARRVSKPPPGAFKLPSVTPRSTKPKHTVEPPKPAERESSPVLFDKPALKPVSRAPESRGGSEERDVTFDKPALRSTSKVNKEAPEEKMDTGVFKKPELRSTPKTKRKMDDSDSDSKTNELEPRRLRTVSKPEEEPKKATSEEKLFETPHLRSTGRKLGSEAMITDSDKNDSAKTFEKPVLRSAKKDFRSDSFDKDDKPEHTFEKPALRTTGLQKSDSVDQKQEETGMFEKPTLKKTTPSPEKEVKISSELKGTFDKPSLRTTPSPEKEVKSIHDAKGVFSKPSLRKTDNIRNVEQKPKVQEKPEWLQRAADKQSKVLDALQSKENHNVSSEKTVPSWLDKSSARKNLKTLPLQDTSNNQSEGTEKEEQGKPTVSSRSRESSFSSDTELNKRKGSLTSGSKEAHNNYTPSWARQVRSPSAHNLVTGMTALSPAKSCPSLAADNEVPQWKKELAQRRLNKKEKSPPLETVKKEESAEPEWKSSIALRKVKPQAAPSKEVHSTEPEWKKAAEEKRLRLRKTAAIGLSDQSEC